MEKTEGTYWNPVSYHLYNASEATAISLDAWALEMCVAVEAITSLISFNNDNNNKAKLLQDFQARFRKWFAVQNEFIELKDRVHGLCSMLKLISPKATLFKLAEEGCVEKKYIKAWSTLRNRHAHPSIVDLKKPDEVDNQELLDNLHCIEVLLRQITFHLIGYEGPFTDYGVRGAPSKQYPLKPDAVTS
jgi:hypothetical protein